MQGSTVGGMAVTLRRKLPGGEPRSRRYVIHAIREARSQLQLDAQWRLALVCASSFQFRMVRAHYRVYLERTSLDTRTLSCVHLSARWWHPASTAPRAGSSCFQIAWGIVFASAICTALAGLLATSLPAPDGSGTPGYAAAKYTLTPSQHRH